MKGRKRRRREKRKMAMKKKRTLSALLLLVFIVSPAFLTFSNSPQTTTDGSVTSSGRILPPTEEAYATDTYYTEGLPKPPPMPICYEPPETLLANQSLTDLVSNQTIGTPIGKIPRNFLVAEPTSSVISAKQVGQVNKTDTAQAGDVVIQSSEIIDSDTKSGNRLKLSTAFYKDMGEQDPKWDYYAVKCTIEDIYAKNDFWNGPLYADIWLFFPDYCQEVPSNHEPQAGFRLSAGEGSFEYEGIGFKMNFPAYSIGFESSTTKYPSWLFCHWSYDGGWGPFAYWYYVFKDYSDGSIGIRVPQGQKPYCYTAGWAVWYRFWIFLFSKDGEEMVYWNYVDPPSIQEHPSPPAPPTRTTPTNPPGPSPRYTNLCVDGFIFVETFTDSSYSKLRYITIGGMGQDGYGYHAGKYSFISLLAGVANNGEPLINVPVRFYLVDPNGALYDFGYWYTDEHGIAGCTFAFDPGSAPQGMWWFIPVYQTASDECGFSYVYCLLITGYTYMSCWNSVYIEDVYLVPENYVVSLTAQPKEGYQFKYWWINFYYECYANPIYLYMDFDCIVLARFDPIPSPPSEYLEGGFGGFRGRPCLQ